MSKPKDKRQKFNKKHKNILAERAELLALIDGWEEQKQQDIEDAIAPLRVTMDAMAKELAGARNESAGRQTLIRMMYKEIDRLANELDAERQARAEDNAAAAEREAKLREEIDAVEPTIADLRQLVERWKNRARRDELERARAALNRLVMAGAKATKWG